MEADCLSLSYPEIALIYNLNYSSIFLVLKSYILQLCDGPIVAFTVLHNVNCCRGLIYVTSQVTCLDMHFSFTIVLPLFHDVHHTMHKPCKMYFFDTYFSSILKLLDIHEFWSAGFSEDMSVAVSI